MVEVHIIQEKQNPLLKRKELILSFPYLNKVTPKKDEVVKVVSASLKVDENLVFLRKIAPIFGQQQAKVYANVYSDQNSMKRYEVVNKKPKKSKGEKPKQQEQKK